jgi:hypothetical protein
MISELPGSWVFGLYPVPGIQKDTAFQKLELFPSSHERIRDTYSVGPTPYLRMGTDPVFEMLCSFELFRILDDGQSPKPSDSKCYTPLSELFRIYVMSKFWLLHACVPHVSMV